MPTFFKKELYKNRNKRIQSWYQSTIETNEKGDDEYIRELELMRRRRFGQTDHSNIDISSVVDRYLSH
ncbi:MAG: hypothetical protein CM15mP96_1330 [Gammaproteobacteria bacterium]|nr:MAG: hypothetical protein CM15mP96_1330 [Gammaproteobacteria bacterium]